MPTFTVPFTPYTMQQANVNVKSYGAAADGTTDDTTAINNAIAALPAAGGIVFLPEGTYAITSAIKIPAGVTIQGAGRQATIVKPLATLPSQDVFYTNIPASQGAASGQTNRAALRDLKLDGTNLTGLVAGGGNGVHFYGANQCSIERVWIVSMPNWGVILDADSTNTSANNVLRDLQIDSCAGGIYELQYSTDNKYENCSISGASTVAAANQGKFSGDTTVYQFRVVGGFSKILGCTFGSSGTSTAPALNIGTANPCRISHNYFNQCRYAGLNIAASCGGHTIIGNEFSDCSAVGTTGAITVSGTLNTFTGNIVDAVPGSAHYTYCVVDGAAVSNKYVGNTLTSGSTGFFSQNATSTNQIIANAGLNPVGDVTAPSFPATTVAATNNTGFDVDAHILNGTGAITVVQIAGVAGSYVTTGLTIAASTGMVIPLAAGSSIKFTYASGSPGWHFEAR